MKKGIMVFLVLCLLLPVTSFAQSAPLTAEQGAAITIMGGAHLTSVTEAVMREFQKAHPEITVNYEKYSYAEYPVKMKVQLSANEAVPDIVLVHDVFVRQFVDAGYLMPLDDMVNTADYLPAFGNVTKDGSIFGLPNQMSNQYVFLYRKDIYEQLGLTPPTTMDEYFAQADVLKQNGYYAGAFDPLTGPTDYFLDFMYMLGGRELNDDGSISMDKAAEALELVKKGYDAGIWHKSSQGSGEAYWTAFNNGEIAAFPAPAYQAAYYETNVDPAGKGGFGKLGIAPAMRFSPDGPATYIRNTEYFAINKNTKYPNAAKMVLQYLCQSTEASVAFSSVNEEGLMARYANGYLPGLTTLAENGSAPWESFGGEQVVSFLAKDLLAKLPTLPYVDSRTAEMRTIMGEVIGEMLENGTYTAEEAAQEMINQIGQL